LDDKKKRKEDSRIYLEANSSLDTLKTTIKDLDTNIKRLQDYLKNAYKERDKQGFSEKLKDEKKKWVRPNRFGNRTINDGVLQRTRLIRANIQYETCIIQNIKEQLSSARSSRYLKQRAVNYKQINRAENTASTNIGNGLKKNIKKECPFLLEKVENVTLSVNPKQYVFSGTDNGLRIMISTVHASLDNYNYYQALHDDKDSMKA
jgi:hypothetical protein